MIYVMQVLTGKEEYVIYFLKKWFLTDEDKAFSPDCELEKKFRGDVSYVTRRLMPGYVFIQTDDPINLYTRLDIAKEHHFFQTMTKFLRSEQVVMPLQDKEEHLLLSLFDENYHTGISQGTIKAGKLRILSGPLMGMEERITKIDRHKKTATLSMQIAEKWVTLKVGLEVKEKS